jgi:hypothetical protein
MEEWRDIPGYIGLYQASNEGRIRSLIRLLPSATEAGIRKEKKVLSPGSDRNGRMHVALSADGKVRHYQVHRLVLLAFVGPCPEGMECLHGDGNPVNCAIGNLRWGTRLENHEDRRRHGRGFGVPKKLTEEQVVAIRESTETQRVLAARYGVSQVTIFHVKNRRTWNM